MTITPGQLDQFNRIYNTLFSISTKGEDTLIMADCLRAFEKNLAAVNNNIITEESDING